MKTARALNSCGVGLAALVLWSLFASTGSACPEVGPFIDMNCDQALRLAFIGDSIVAGRGDAIHGGQGGYPLRISKHFRKAEVKPLGYPGISARRLFSRLSLDLNSSARNSVKRKLRGADIVLLDVERNDWWEGTPPGAVVLYLSRMVELLRAHYKKTEGETPLILVARLLPIKLSYETGFVAQVNTLLGRYRSSRLPAHVRFDHMPAALLSWDGIHPASAGYDWLADAAERYFLGRAQVMCAAARPDRDQDGIFDLFERMKYHTWPEMWDTDGDTYGDGDEVFVLHTDPLDPLDPPPATPAPTPTPLS